MWCMKNFLSMEFITKRQLPNDTTTTSVDRGWNIMLYISVPLTVITMRIWWLRLKCSSSR